MKEKQATPAPKINSLSAMFEAREKRIQENIAAKQAKRAPKRIDSLSAVFEEQAKKLVTKEALESRAAELKGDLETFAGKHVDVQFTSTKAALARAVVAHFECWIRWYVISVMKRKINTESLKEARGKKYEWAKLFFPTLDASVDSWRKICETSEGNALRYLLERETRLLRAASQPKADARGTFLAKVQRVAEFAVLAGIPDDFTTALCHAWLGKAENGTSWAGEVTTKAIVELTAKLRAEAAMTARNVTPKLAKQLAEKAVG